MERTKNNTHKDLKQRWIAIKENLSEDSVLGIEEVYNIFFERIENRYFKPIKLLKSHDDSIDGYGFSMVAILCSLIEFLQSTIDGKFHKKTYGNEFRSKYQLLDSRNLLTYYQSGNSKKDNEFVNFLKELDLNFKINPIGYYDSIAREFYDCVRCALLHDACTRNNWIIREKTEKKLIFDYSNSEGKILYRNNFFEKIYEKVNIGMREQFVKDLGFRKNLLKKMDIIFETANYCKKGNIPFWWN